MIDYEEYQEKADNDVLVDSDGMEQNEMPALTDCISLAEEYREAKDSIEFSRNAEEQAYWQKRADEIWMKCDEEDFQTRNNNIKK